MQKKHAGTPYALSHIVLTHTETHRAACTVNAHLNIIIMAIL